MRVLTLNSAPRFDDATQYSFRWNRKLIEDYGVTDITELLEDDATPENFNRNASGINLFIFYDHGDRNGLVAQGGKEYLVDSSNVERLRGAEVYTMCCLTAKGLGADAYRKGVKIWWGYTKVFSFIPQSEEIYCELSNLGLLLVKKDGLDWNKALDKVKESFTAAIEKNDEENGDPWVSITLLNDRDALVCWTEQNPPPTTCVFRKMAINYLGSAGHRLTRKSALSFIAFIAFWGFGLHDAGHHIWELKGTAISLEGVYVGFTGMLLSFLFYTKEHIRWHTRS